MLKPTWRNGVTLGVYHRAYVIWLQRVLNSADWSAAKKWIHSFLLGQHYDVQYNPKTLTLVHGEANPTKAQHFVAVESKRVSVSGVAMEANAVAIWTAPTHLPVTCYTGRDSSSSRSTGVVVRCTRSPIKIELFLDGVVSSSA